MDWLSVVFEQVARADERLFRLAVLLAIYFIARELRMMRGSMDKLHIALGKILDKVNGHELRIRSLEKKK